MIERNPGKTANKGDFEVDLISIESDKVVLLAQEALMTQSPGSTKTVRNLARSLRDRHPETAHRLTRLLKVEPSRMSSLAVETPLDLDSRMPLIRVEDPARPDRKLVLSENAKELLAQLVAERARPELLIDAGLAPSRTALFVGPPGVGKTTAARFVADGLELPLLVLDLSSVISSFLGKTGSNIRRVFDYARSRPAVLLLDEFDAVAKSRGDNAEVGELKRLVTVLLQEMDDWPESSLLVAATNHQESLDPAVWRRFDVIVEFSLPTRPEIVEFLDSEPLVDGVSAQMRDLLASAYVGCSFSRLSTDLARTRRRAALAAGDVDEAVLHLVAGLAGALDNLQRKNLAVALQTSGLFSQRLIAHVLGMSRDTIRRAAQEDSK